MRFTIFLAACVCLPFEAAAQPASSQQSSRPGWPCAGKVDPAYVQIAEGTGGKVLLFHPTELEGAALDERASREHDETVFRAAGQLAGESYKLIVPIDATIETCTAAVGPMPASGHVDHAVGTGARDWHARRRVSPVRSHSTVCCAKTRAGRVEGDRCRKRFLLDDRDREDRSASGERGFFRIPLRRFQIAATLPHSRRL